MKQKLNHILVLLASVGLMACSSTPTSPGKQYDDPGAQQPISKQLATSTFDREGIKFTYTFFGNLEAIEAVGYAPVWGNSEQAVQQSIEVAYIMAKDRMSSFLHNENIASHRFVGTIAKNLEKAQDNKENQFSSNTSRVIETSDLDIGNISGGRDNVALRNDALLIATTIKTSVSINRSGILGGVIFKEAQVINSGKNVKVVVIWSRQTNKLRSTVQNEMLGK